MKSTTLSVAAALVLAASHADAFFLPAGSLVGGASSTSVSLRDSVSSSSSSTIARAAAHITGCSCSSCSRAHGRSCNCPSCSPGVSARSLGAGRRSGACSLRMKAHPQGCGCGDCSTAPAAFHSASCKCPDCNASRKCADCGVSCTCGSRTSRRRASSATVMRMGADQVSDAGEGLRARLIEEPDSVMFEDAMAAIEAGFDYFPKRFVNGATSSDAGENEGSCKVFAFGKISGLSSPETLACFGEHYRGVLADPEGDSHGNIRAFMESGWDGVEFPDGLSLSPK